jgi:hypothetical protein
MMTDKIELIDHGVMLSAYFSGTAGVMLPLAIDSKTTVGQIIDQLESEISMLWEHIEYTAEYHGFVGDLEKQIDLEVQKIKEENKDNLDKIHMPGLEFDFDTESQDDLDMREYPVLILTIEFNDR